MIEMQTFKFKVNDEDKAVDKDGWIFSNENEVMHKLIKCILVTMKSFCYRNKLRYLRHLLRCI